ncbi:BLOC-1-related complex subunit 8 isoform X3 [Rhinoderma darwinii]|uniref:BLOC-1-related complex subunit 8 isoform X3 n=1 Tax=Rhinoderma darwinii TaxID=43563 RepID=UPI003F679DAA
MSSPMSLLWLYIDFKNMSAGLFQNWLNTRWADMQNWEEQSQGSVYTVEYACSAVKSMTFSSVHFKSIDGLLKQAINLKHQLNTVQSRR